MELFERRLAIFDATWQELSNLIQGSSIQITNPIFNNLFPQAEFLFGHDIRAYMQYISKKTGELWVITESSKANSNIIRSDDIQPRLEIMKWFYEQAANGCKDKFSEYLDFSKWR